MKVPRSKPMKMALLGLLFVFLFAFVPHAFAFSSDQAASLEIGQRSFAVPGTGICSEGLPANVSTLNCAAGAAFDKSGNLWVADEYNSRVLEYTYPFSNGMDASLVIGQPNFTANKPTGYPRPPTTASGLQYPRGVAFDSSGNLWVADTDDNRVLEFVPGTSGCPSGQFCDGMNASLVIGQSSFTTEGYAWTRSTLQMPSGIAFDSSGNLWVVDTANSRVLEFVPGTSGCPSGQFCDGMNASLVIGQSSFTTAGYATTQSGLYSPLNVAFDKSGNLWVSDEYNNRVLEYTYPFSNGMDASLVIGQPNFTVSTVADKFYNPLWIPTASGLWYPWGLAFDSSGNLWVADEYNSRVLEFTYPFSNGMNASLVIGQLGLTDPRLTLPNASGMYSPSAVVLDKSGNLWVADFRYNRVLEYSGPLTTTTTTSSSTGTVAPGTLVTDTATVAAVSSTAGAPTGSVQFYFCGPTDTATPCAISPAHLFGAPVTLSAGSAESPESEGPTAAGFYCWSAVYTPDTAAFTGSSSTTTTNECFDVAAPTTTTTTTTTVTSPTTTTQTASTTSTATTMTTTTTTSPAYTTSTSTSTSFATSTATSTTTTLSGTCYDPEVTVTQTSTILSPTTETTTSTYYMTSTGTQTVTATSTETFTTTTVVPVTTTTTQVSSITECLTTVSSSSSIVPPPVGVPQFPLGSGLAIAAIGILALAGFMRVRSPRKPVSA